MKINQPINGDPTILDLVHNKGLITYVKDGEIFRNVPLQLVEVSSESELSILTDFLPGTIAYIAGFQSMWQKAPDGTWASF